MRSHARAVAAFSALLMLTLGIGAISATATAPTVSIDAPSGVSYTSAHVSGKVDPEDQETSWRFEYSSEPANEFSWQWGPSGGPLAANSGETVVEGDLTELGAGTEYSVRLVAENADGQTISPAPYPTFTTVAVPAPSFSIEAPASITASGAHFTGTINPQAPAGNPPAFDVGWRFACEPFCPDLSGGTIPADSSPHTVEVDATGLNPGTDYVVRLIVNNAGGYHESAPQSFTTATAAPAISKVEAAPLTTEANLSAKINPGGLGTSYHFEYGPTTSYGQSSTSKNLTATGTPVPARATLFGLSPATTYHYRAVAANADGSVFGPDQTFTTLPALAGGNCPNEAIRAAQNALALSDCRALEMASPADKNGGDITLHSVQSTPDGNGIAFQSTAAFAGSEGGAHLDAYIARRGVETWQTRGVTPYQRPEPWAAFAPVFGPEAFSPDLTKMVFTNANSPDRNETEPSLNQRLLWLGEGGGYRQITPSASSPGPFEPPQFMGAADDMGHVFFESREKLTADAPPEGVNTLYEWADGDVRVASVLPDGTVASGMAKINSFASKHAVSPDGSQVVFESGSPLQVYLRSDSSSTVAVSASQKSGAAGTLAPAGATFVGSASADGSTLSEIFFISSSELTDDANTGPGEEGKDLYSYDVASGVLTDLTAVSGPDTPIGADVSYELGGFGDARFQTSTDGSYVYFTANGKLTPDASIVPTPKLYVEHEGTIRLVTHIEGAGFPKDAIAASGKALGFTGAAQMAGYPESFTEQVFFYEYPTDRLTCVSCPVGRPPTNTAGFSGVISGEASYPLHYSKRNVSADGSSVFFETPEALDPLDSNGKVDVYQWSNGRATLISGGLGGEDSHFVDASADGSNVFFGTRSPLIANDPDRSMDLYDARINGGLPLPPVPGAPCEGDACQTPVRAPSDPTPASAGFHGQGNEKPRFGNARKKKQKKQRKKKRASRKPGKSHGKSAKSKPSTRRHG